MGLKGLLKTLALCLPLLAAPLFTLAEPVYVKIKTDRGNLVLELYPEQAPATVENFLTYANGYFYDGLIFHRVVKDFVIQSGAYTYDLVRKEPDEPVVNESANGLKNRRGTIAMARLSDPDSATSQFYINLSDNPNLDAGDGEPGYTVFGRLIQGMDVADDIGNLAVAPQEKFSHLPVEPAQILSVREIEKP